VVKSGFIVLLLIVVTRVAFAGGDSLSVSGPFSYGALTIWLLDGPSTIEHPYLTLEQALERGSAVIHENNSQTLWIENRSDTDLFVQSTDLIKGGQQDRMVQDDQIIAPHTTSYALNVYCIEKGRSTKRGAEPLETFSSSHWMAPLPHMRIVARHDLTSQLLTPHLGGLTAPDSSQLELFESVQTPILPFGTTDPAQESVWGDVSNVQHGLTTVLRDSVTQNASPTSLELALEATSLKDREHAFEKHLKDIAEDDKNAVGYVYAIGDKIVASDIYGSHALFLSMWPKLLRAAGAEAILTNAVQSTPPDEDAVRSFLERASHGKTAKKQVNDRTTVEATSSDNLYIFRTWDTQHREAVVHEAILAKE